MTRRSAVTEEERRDLSMAVARPEVRNTDGGSERFDGHAAVFDTRTAIGNPLRWGFYEEISRGAFTKTLSEGDARMLIDHNSYYVVSRVSAGTLRLNEDPIGLHTDSVLDTELSYVSDLKVNLRNGNITGMSFGFYVVKDDWAEEEVELNDGNTATVEVRTIQEVRLVEVSAVTFPAYPTTDAGLRSVALALRARGDDAAIQRRLGLNPDLAQYLGDRRVVAPGADVKPVDHSEESEVDRSEQQAVESTEEEPAETTPRSQDSSDSTDDGTEPAETTRNAPTVHQLAAARLRALKGTIRRSAA
jgi:Escherichia/Staphylococcus phage prohead protease